MITNNKNKKEKIMKFNVVQTIVRNGEWIQETVAQFATEQEAKDCAKRCHNGNPTTRVEKK